MASNQSLYQQKMMKYINDMQTDSDGSVPEKVSEMDSFFLQGKPHKQNISRAVYLNFFRGFIENEKKLYTPVLKKCYTIINLASFILHRYDQLDESEKSLFFDRFQDLIHDCGKQNQSLVSIQQMPSKKPKRIGPFNTAQDEINWWKNNL
jgi:hypothetical protein